MVKRKFFFISLLILVFSCSPKIKTITEYYKKENSFSKNRMAEFDKKGNKLVVRNFGNPRSNRIIRMEYDGKNKMEEVACDYFEKQDTCVIRQFTRYQYDKDNLIKSTVFEADTAVRLVRNYRRFGDMEVIKTHTWEMFPKKNPDPEKAMKLTDTIYYDDKNRKIKIIHHNADFKEPWVEIFSYNKNGYTKETRGTRRDTILEFRYSDLQKKANKKNIDFNFHNGPDYRYEIEYY